MNTIDLNMGFRVRPSFNKLVNKENKEINYTINPNQAVRDSFEFSNLINNDIDIEEKIKEEITDEQFHEAVQKEIERRDILEKNRQDKTKAELRGDGIPSSLPERAAQVKAQIFDISTEVTQQDIDDIREKSERADMEKEDIQSTQNEINAQASIKASKRTGEAKVQKTTKTKVATFFGPMALQRMKPAVEQMASIPEVKPSIISTGLSDYGNAKQIKTRTNGPYAKNKPRRSKTKQQPISEGLIEDQPMEVEEPPMEVEQATTTTKQEVMSVDTAGEKRAAPNTKEDILKRARAGELVTDFPKVINRATIPMIQHQMVMRGIPFDQKDLKDVLKLRINTSNWVDAVEEETAKKRLKEYKEEHGVLPIENIKASSSKQGEKRVGSANTEPKAKAKTEPKAKAEPKQEPKAKAKAKAEPKQEPKAKAKTLAAITSGNIKQKSDDPEPKAKAKAAPKPKSQPASSSNEPPQAANSSNEPPPKTQARDRTESISSMSSEDVSQFQQAPIVMPSKANPTILREHLAKALFSGKINDIADVDLYNRIKDVREYKKATAARKKEILKTLRDIYAKHVYEPAKVQRRQNKLEAKQRRKQTHTTNVKKTNLK